MQGFFITGTGTEVGKTIATALLSLGFSHHGVSCCPIKPIASGGTRIENDLVSEDAVRYQIIAQRSESIIQLNPFCLEYPASPHLSAKLQNTEIPIHQIIEDIKHFSANYDAVLIEGAGGWLVPLNNTIMMRDMANMLGLPIIVVAANVLGTINHTLLTVESIRQSGQAVAGVIFTHPTLSNDKTVHEDNRQTIAQLANVPILGEIPHLPQYLLKGNNQDQLWNSIKDTIKWKTITALLNTTRNL